MKSPHFTFEGGRKQTFLNLESGSKNLTVGKISFLWLLRGRICMAFDDARTLNCSTKAGAHNLTKDKGHSYCYQSMSGRLIKQVVYFNSFNGLRLVDFDSFWFLFLIPR